MSRDASNGFCVEHAQCLGASLYALCCGEMQICVFSACILLLCFQHCSMLHASMRLTFALFPFFAPQCFKCEVFLDFLRAHVFLFQCCVAGWRMHVSVSKCYCSKFGNNQLLVSVGWATLSVGLLPVVQFSFVLLCAWCSFLFVCARSALHFFACDLLLTFSCAI